MCHLQQDDVAVTASPLLLIYNINDEVIQFLSDRVGKGFFENRSINRTSSLLFLFEIHFADKTVSRVQLTQYECDQMSRLFFNTLPFTTI